MEITHNVIMCNEEVNDLKLLLLILQEFLWRHYLLVLKYAYYPNNVKVINRECFGRYLVRQWLQGQVYPLLRETVHNTKKKKNFIFRENQFFTFILNTMFYVCYA
jgi:hypothetical protein